MNRSRADQCTPAADQDGDAVESSERRMPEVPTELLPAERLVYDALILATHERAAELGERWVWNIATSRWSS